MEGGSFSGIGCGKSCGKAFVLNFNEINDDSGPTVQYGPCSAPGGNENTVPLLFFAPAWGTVPEETPKYPAAMCISRFLH